MQIDAAIEAFGHLPVPEKLDVLLHLAHALTILARDTYEVGGAGLTQPARLRRLNEVQHRVTSSVLALRTPAAPRYPDDVLVQIILDHPEDRELERHLHALWERLMTPVVLPPS
jgi:hypothetical protein